MTKSPILIIGNAPELLLERHRMADAYELVDVTAALQALSDEIASAPFPAGINSSPAFRKKLALDKAAARLFGEQPYWVYDHPDAPPSQHILHNHLIRDGGDILLAMQKSETGAEPHRPVDDWRNNPFDYWWRPDITYLPLRRDSAVRPYHARTVIMDLPSWYADCPSTNIAVHGDVDLAPIARARQAITDDLLAKTAQLLETCGLGGNYDWQPRFRGHGFARTENPTYAQQPKVRALGDALPDHAQRIDYLLLGEADLRLYADWAALPVAGLITEDGYLDAIRPGWTGDAAGQRFLEITGTSLPFLQALRDAWQHTPPDMLVSVYCVHE